MKLWKFIHTKLQQNKHVYLLVVIQHKGSSPGRQGFKMAVADDGDICGSIGGGVMEYKLVERCKKLLKGKDYISFIKHQVHKGNIIDDSSGMICSGEQTVIFYPLNNSYLSTIEKILTTLNTPKKGILFITPSHFSFSMDTSMETTFTYSYISETHWSYKELINKKNTIYIVGGGHVGLATSTVLKQLDFYVVVFDSRANLNTFEENNTADKKLIVDYNDIASYIPEGNSSYVAIMTNKYTDDKLVLGKLLQRNYNYLGVLGSEAKLNLLFETLLKEGFSKQVLDSVYAPIGLHIHSQTPLEIAISIGAEIVSIKNRE